MGRRVSAGLGQCPINFVCVTKQEEEIIGGGGGGVGRGSLSRGGGIDEEAERSPFCSLRQLFTFHISYTANCLHYNANSCLCMKYLHATQLFVFHFLHTVSRVSCNFSGLISFSQVRYGFLRSGMVNSFHRLGMVFSGLVWFSQFWYLFAAVGNCLHLIFPPPPSAQGLTKCQSH